MGEMSRMSRGHYSLHELGCKLGSLCPFTTRDQYREGEVKGLSRDVEGRLLLGEKVSGEGEVWSFFPTIWRGRLGGEQRASIRIGAGPKRRHGENEVGRRMCQ